MTEKMQSREAMIRGLERIADLERDIDAWVEREIGKDGEGTPDFWDELNTSERLAEHLTALGYRKVVAR